MLMKVYNINNAANAKVILQAADLKLINNSMQIVFDNSGIQD